MATVLEHKKQRDKDGYYLSVARTIAFGSKCPEGKQHGCIAVKHSRIVSTGYNGAPAGRAHCEPCRLDEYKANNRGKKDFTVCPAVHAEINCIITAAKIGTSIIGSTLYVTKCPCQDCLKALQNMELKGVIYMDEMTGDHWCMEGPELEVVKKLMYGRKP